MVFPQMKISGFSFCRNGDKLYYPVAESIRSVLPICDEFVVAVGRGDADDRTRQVIEAIGDPRIRIIDTEWTDRERLRGWIHSQQTNIALRECTGDWCFYVQSDEVVHEKDLPTIRARCEELTDDPRVEGLLFRYLHFWGDYDHVHRNHAWYPHEIRMIRNGLGIESFRTAQSFRRNGKKLRVASVDADIYHYGWVRPPEMMKAKSIEFDTTHQGRKVALERHGGKAMFDYGSLATIPRFRGTHPAVMNGWMARFSWADQLHYEGPSLVRHRHDQFKYRLLSWIEQRLLLGRIHLGALGYRRIRRYGR
jgi:hypothetical protein